MNASRTRRRIGRIIAVVAVLALVAAGGVWVFGGTGDKRITAYFSRAVGVYPGSDVQVLGVRVGTVESVTPRGERVEVVFTLDDEVAVAADTNAVVVAPSVVSDRYLQLTDLARGGRELADGAVIQLDRTATPIELDELYASLNTLVSALGPDGANSDGALSELLETGAENLDGNGAAFNETVRNFAAAAQTLSGSADDLFGTVDELQQFTTMLAGNDRQVQSVNTQLDQVWRTLSADREELSTALNTLALALSDIQRFVQDNRARIKSNVDKLAATTQLLVDNRASLAEALDVAPLAVTNVLNAFDPESETLQGRALLLEYYADLPPMPLPVSDGSVAEGGGS